MAIAEALISGFFLLATFGNWPGPLYARGLGVVYVLCMNLAGFACLGLVVAGRFRAAMMIAPLIPICLAWAALTYG